MLFDTGSAVIYAISDKCAPNECPKNNTRYDTRSKTLHDSATDREELHYGEGYVSGSIGKENICFSSNSCVNQVEMLVGDIGSKLEADQFTGIIGLAPQNDPNNHLHSFVE